MKDRIQHSFSVSGPSCSLVFKRLLFLFPLILGSGEASLFYMLAASVSTCHSLQEDGCHINAIIYQPHS